MKQTHVCVRVVNMFMIFSKVNEPFVQLLVIQTKHVVTKKRQQNNFEIGTEHF